MAACAMGLPGGGAGMCVCVPANMAAPAAPASGVMQIMAAVQENLSTDAATKTIA